MNPQVPVLCHPEDSFIDRPLNNNAQLCDEEGMLLASFPSRWSDEDILIALEFANRAYAQGVEAGQKAKAAEVRSVLNIGA
jgi:hypothetical protein